MSNYGYSSWPSTTQRDEAIEQIMGLARLYGLERTIPDEVTSPMEDVYQAGYDAGYAARSAVVVKYAKTTAWRLAIAGIWFWNLLMWAYWSQDALKAMGWPW